MVVEEQRQKLQTLFCNGGKLLAAVVKVQKFEWVV
jgi:hypothetical protein